MAKSGKLIIIRRRSQTCLDPMKSRPNLTRFVNPPKTSLLILAIQTGQESSHHNMHQGSGHNELKKSRNGFFLLPLEPSCLEVRQERAGGHGDRSREDLAKKRGRETGDIEMNIILDYGSARLGLKSNPARQDIKHSRAKRKGAIIMNDPGTRVFINIDAPEWIAEGEGPFRRSQTVPPR